MVSYEETTKKLIPVTVNGNAYSYDRTSLQTYLNNIYKQAVITWQVEPAINIDVEIPEDFDASPSDLMAYTSDMRKLKRAVEDKDNDAYYLFFVPKSKENGQKGIMPLGRHYGYIFTNLSSGEEDLNRTIAHELGHGPFALYHPFDEYPAVSQGSTENLMDYSTGTRLRKYQWDLIHDPVFVFGGGSAEEASSMAKGKWACVNDEIEFEGSVFFNPAKEPIDIGDAKPYIFFSAEEEDETLRGCLVGFTKDNIVYKGRLKKENDKDVFAHYAQQDNNDNIYEESKGDISKAQLVLIDTDKKTYEIKVGNSVVKNGSLSDCNCNDIICSAGKEFIEAHRNEKISEETLQQIAEIICKYGTTLTEDYNQFALASMPKWMRLMHVDSDLPMVFSQNEYELYLKGLQDWFDWYEKIKDVITETKDQELMFKITSQITFPQLQSLSIEEKVRMLYIIASSSLNDNLLQTIFGIYNEENIALRVLKSVKDDEAVEFLNKIQEAKYVKKYKYKYYDIITNTQKTWETEVSLYIQLFRELDDWGGTDNFTRFVAELNRIILIANGIDNPADPAVFNKAKDHIIWADKDFDDDDFKGSTEHSLEFRDNNTLVFTEDICTSIEITIVQDPNIYPPAEVVKCINTDTREIGPLNHFDLITINFYKNPTFLEVCQQIDCKDTHIITFAGYLDYMLTKRQTEITEDVIITTLEVASFVIGIGEISAAIRAGKAIRAIIGAYALLSDAYSFIIESEAFKIWLRESFPDSHEEISDVLTIIDIFNMAATVSVDVIYNGVKVSKAKKFVGYFEGFKELSDGVNPLGKLTAKELKTLEESYARVKHELKILGKSEKIEREIAEAKKFIIYGAKVNAVAGLIDNLSPKGKKFVSEFTEAGGSVKADDAGNILLIKKSGDTDTEIGKIVKKGDDDALEILDTRITDKLNTEDLPKIQDDCFNNSNLLAKFVEEPELVDAWNVLKEAPEVIRFNDRWLKFVKNIPPDKEWVIQVNSGIPQVYNKSGKYLADITEQGIKIPKDRWGKISPIQIEMLIVDMIADSRATLKMREIKFMQSSISNQTGNVADNYFVLKNAKGLLEGSLTPEVLGPVNVWKNSSSQGPGFWTLDHRRLAAYKLAGIEDVPIVWAGEYKIIDEAWKMTTKNIGKEMDIRMFFDPNTGKFVFKKQGVGQIEEIWHLKEIDGNTYKVFDKNGDEINLLNGLNQYID